MMNFIIALSVIIGSAAVFSGCSDKDCSLPTQTAVVSDQDNLIDIDAQIARIAPSNTDDMFMKGDRVGPGGNRDSVRGGGRDSVMRDSSRVRPVPFTAILPCLKLTADQAAKLRQFMMAERDCEKGARELFRTVLEPLRKAQKAEMDAIRADVQSGVITREEAAAKVKAINERIRAASLQAESALRASIKECMDTFFMNFESILTPEQLALWMEWKRTGKNPCPGTGNPIGIRP